MMNQAIKEHKAWAGFHFFSFFFLSHANSNWQQFQF